MIVIVLLSAVTLNLLPRPFFKQEITHTVLLLGVNDNGRWEGWNSAGPGLALSWLVNIHLALLMLDVIVEKCLP